jgi:hypothetical protein
MNMLSGRGEWRKEGRKEGGKTRGNEAKLRGDGGFG